MMKKLLTIICGTILVLSIFSCSNEQKDIWDESSAQRLNRAVAEYKEILCNAENGWVMEYFPTDSRQGYTFLVNFRQTGGITMAANDNFTGNEYKEDKSLFDVIADNGPVLTFNTYNDIIHYFCNPEDIPGTDDKENGRGYEGDYEFIVMKVADDFVQLKGKKRNTDIRLKKLNSDVNWKDYLSQLVDMNRFLFDSRINTLTLNFPDRFYIGTNGIKHLFSFVESGHDVITESMNVPFLITPTGLRFYKSFSDENNSYISAACNFEYDEEKQVLISKEDPSVFIAPPAKAIYLNEYPSTYMGGEAQMSGQFADVFNKMKVEFHTVYNGKRDLTSIGFTTKNGVHTLILKASANLANFTIPFAVSSENTITIGEIDADNFPSGSMDTNAKNFYKSISSIKELLSILSGEYRIESKVPFNLNEVKYIKAGDVNSYMIVSRD